MKRRPLHAAILIACLSHVALLAVSATDDFNRTDNASIGVNWTAVASTLPGVVSNQTTVDAGATILNVLAMRTAETYANNQYSEIVVSTSDASDYSFVLVRMSGSWGAVTASGYFYACSSAAASGTLGKFVNNVQTNFQTGLGACTSGQTIRAEVDTTIRGYVNGVQQGTSASDPDLSSGPPGFGFYHNALGSSPVRLDNWAGGDLGGGGGGGSAPRSLTLLGVGGWR